jgi:hypothetical protein
MLAADKLQLQSAYKQQATALKEKEFNLHHSNLMTVGTQAAVLAGLDITMFIEFNPPFDGTYSDWPRLAQAYHVPRLLKLVYYGIIVAAFCANMLVVSHTTALSVLGAGLALRGPDGSMLVATDVVYEERKAVFVIFGYGLLLTVGSVLISVWLLLHWEAACVCWMVTLMGCRQIYCNYQRVARRLHFNEHESVDFSDILPATTMGHNKRNSGGGGSSSSHNKNSPPTRQQQQSKDRRHYFKRSVSSPVHHQQQDQNNPNAINIHHSARPSSHYCRGNGGGGGGDEEDGRGGGGPECYYYNSNSSEEGNDDDDDDSTRRLMVGNGHHHHHQKGNMKQRRSSNQHSQSLSSQDSSSRDVIQTV